MAPAQSNDAPTNNSSDAQPGGSESVEWAIVLHGGAGTLPGDTQQDYESSLRQALDVGVEQLNGGASAVDAVEAVVAKLEDLAIFNAGKGAVFTTEGTHELDASIMDGHTLEAGAVTVVGRLKNPIHAARLVMDKSPHVLLAGSGAEAFATRHGCEVVEPSYFYTPSRFVVLQEHMRKNNMQVLDRPAYPLPRDADSTPQDTTPPGNTVGCVALDSQGRLAAATSTGGMNGKMPGRIGDSPIIGAGTYANDTCAVSGTGWGEKYIRHSIAARVVWLVEGGKSPADAVDHCLTKVLQPNDGGLIAIDKHGEVVAMTNTDSMPHAIADSTGRREVGIWIDKQSE